MVVGARAVGGVRVVGGARAVGGVVSSTRLISTPPVAAQLPIHPTRSPFVFDNDGSALG